MSSFTDGLKETDPEHESREWDLKMARRDLRDARQRKDHIDVSGHIQDIRFWSKSVNTSLDDLGTSEDELGRLLQAGYKSEADTWLSLARDMYGHSRLCLYMLAVKNSGYSFFKKPNFYSFKWFLATIFCFQRRRTRQDCVASAREYLAKTNLSLSDIDTDEAELIRLES